MLKDKYILVQFLREKKQAQGHDPQAYALAKPYPGSTVNQILSDLSHEQYLRSRWRERRLRLLNGHELPSS